MTFFEKQDSLEADWKPVLPCWRAKVLTRYAESQVSDFYIMSGKAIIERCYFAASPLVVFKSPSGVFLD